MKSGSARRTVLIALAAGCLSGTALAASVPLPLPRPADAPQAMPPNPADKPAAEAPVSPPPPSACRLALTDAIAIAPTLPPISGPGECGGDDLVRLEAVVMPDKSRVPLKPAATLRCTMATAVAEWVRGDVAAIATGLGTAVSELDNFDSYNCRGRNRVFGAKMSEHGRANALDLRAIKLANGKSIALTERETPREQREKVLGSVCGRFSTVLGPGSDGYHEDHIHLDLAERRSGYRICQWAVLDPMPATAPLMPTARPDEAPPRDSEEERAKRLKEEAAQPPQAAAPVAAPVQPVTGPKGASAAAPQLAKPEPAKPGPTGTARSRVATPQPTKPLEIVPPAKPPQAARRDASKSARAMRARREPSLIESIFQLEPVRTKAGPKRKKGAGPADAFR